VLLLDCGLEYQKGESQTNIEVTKEGDFARLLEIEEEHIRDLCGHIIAFKPDLVITEKGRWRLISTLLICDKGVFGTLSL
jgi:T-complex protein 1 subunit gamma